MKKIILTGGGTAGHVTPNIALIPKLKQKGFDIHYIGTKDGIENKLIKEISIPYYEISSGKLRRYIDIKNLTDILKVIKGIHQSVKIIKKIKPNVIFSKGGFVALPVVIGGWLTKVPIVVHESDMTPGLANRIAMPFAKTVCTTFKDTLKYIPDKKGVHTGTPIRDELHKGNKQIGLKTCSFDNKKAILLVMCGSLGSVKINGVVREALSDLLVRFNIIHICGKNNIEKNLLDKTGYKQFEYVSAELPHLIAAADVIISRAGANSISEYLELKKPSLLIPLGTNASRGDQILNANSFLKSGYASVLPEEKLGKESLIEKINELYDNKESYINKMEKNQILNSAEKIIDLLKNNL